MIAGHHRLAALHHLAASGAEIGAVPVVVWGGYPGLTVMPALAENTARLNMGPLDRALAVAACREALAAAGEPTSVRRIAVATGLASSTVSECLRIAALVEEDDFVRAVVWSEGPGGHTEVTLVSTTPNSDCEFLGTNCGKCIPHARAVLKGAEPAAVTRLDRADGTQIRV